MTLVYYEEHLGFLFVVNSVSHFVIHYVMTTLHRKPIIKH